MTVEVKPIITSILDTDAYKLHMQQAVFHMYPSVKGSFEFYCRNKDDHLGNIADAVKKQVELMQYISLTDEEYEYLSSKRYLRKDYLNWLRQYRFNPQQVTIRALPIATNTTNGNKSGDSHNNNNNETNLSISIEGPWVETILWEVPLLAIVSEVTHRLRTPHIGVTEAISHLNNKLDNFFANTPEETIETFRVSDFGTRRRYSFEVQEAVVKTLQSHPKFGSYFCGTSNYLLAMKYHLQAVGTQAHEWFQAHQQLTPVLRDSQRVALTQWLVEYPQDLHIALTDCISMDIFLKDFSKDLADAYNGLRHDSGDPFEWGRKAITHYQHLGIDTKSKTLVFSDSLDLEKAATLHRTFANKIQVLCGIGTQLTCSIPGVRPLNIVIKMTGCEGKPVAKISDAPGKSMVHDCSFVSELQRVFGLPTVSCAAAGKSEAIHGA
ncbi:putative nicotinate phosphoribosyltransferase [Trypanosoma theileri]|uniref:nicotinate phosphoribosyltransferase n=1 Tax=Trypanosoma theileri TaxID=67003 RepID=A0A1X0P0W2_9TRYP|nr:putative nicotinate phosphoribosyltransferase [Trypanosoma theileri]ORC90552.1 putative nicotinate phosphoribosyltransferase [Trypanosoma theileri]